MKYFGNWDSYDSMIQDLYRRPYDYEKHEYKEPVLPEDAPKDDEIKFAAYGTPSYEGYALIVYERGGKLYELNGYHCSCYGLDETMDGPAEETSAEALGMRKLSSYQEFGDDAIKAFNEMFPGPRDTKD